MLFVREGFLILRGFLLFFTLWGRTLGSTNWVPERLDFFSPYLFGEQEVSGMSFVERGGLGWEVAAAVAKRPTFVCLECSE